MSDDDCPESFESLHPRAIIGMRVSAWLALAAVAAVLLILLAVGLGKAGLLADAFGALAALALALLLLGLRLGWRYAELRFARTCFRLDEHGLEIRRGVWWRSRIRIPRSRVQHTDVHQGPLDRRWEIADLTVFTAGSEGAAVALAGLPAERALALRDALLQGHDRQL